MMAVGLVVGIGFDPSPADFEELLDRGLIPQAGFQFSALELSAEEASDREMLRTMYQGACVNQGWHEGVAYADALKTAEVSVSGKPVVIVQPEGFDEADKASGE